MPLVSRSSLGLRLFGDSLIPDEITRLLGAPPSDSRIKGEESVGRVTGRISIAKTGRWLLDAIAREPADLDAQVAEILSQLTDDLPIWHDLTNRYKVDMFCGLFMEEGNEGVVLSPLSLAALGQRGITIDFDIYGPMPEERRDDDTRSSPPAT